MPDRTPIRDWLVSLETFGIKLGLTHISRLLEALGHPERAYRVITVAGTNGKGSVTAMIARGLREAGERTGRYTSPHLVDIEERIVIDGRPIETEAFDAYADRVRRASERLSSPPTFFEATTAVALLAFRELGVTSAVLEVGLGGRLDATNAVDASLVAITSIDFDHEAHLGSTLTAIAGEKAGVIKAGAHVCVAPNDPAVFDVIRSRAADVGATVTDASDGTQVVAKPDVRGSVLSLRTPARAYGSIRLALAGSHQVDNAVVAVRTLEVAATIGWSGMTERAIVAALSDVEWPGRLEWRQHRGHEVLLDGAHNPAGARALASFLQDLVKQPVPLVLGVMRDKNADGILRTLTPVASRVFATAITSPRAMAPDVLAAECRRVAPACPVLPYGDPMTAVDDAVLTGSPVVVAGSLFLVGSVRARLQSQRDTFL